MERAKIRTLHEIYSFGVNGVMKQRRAIKDIEKVSFIEGKDLRFRKTYLFRKAGVDNIDNSIYGKGCLSNVGGNYYLASAGWCRLENLRLEI